MKRFTVLALSLVLVGAGALEALAARRTLFGDQEEKSVITVGPRAAVFSGEDIDDPVWQGGAQVRFHLGDILAAEGSADYRKEEIGPSDVHVYPVQATLLAYLLPKKSISPYLLGGTGWYFTSVEGPEGFDNTENRFGLHGGAGVQFFLTNRISVDTSYRYLWVETLASQDESLTDKDYDDRGHQFTGAVNLHF